MVIVQNETIFINKYKKDHPGFYLDENLKPNLDNHVIKAIKKNFDVVLLFTGMEGCLDESTLIQTNNGNKYLKEFRNNQIISIKSFNFEKRKIVDSIAIVKNSGNKDIYEIKLENEKSINATLEHKFFIKKINKIIEIELKNIKEGDLLVCLD